MEWTYPAIHEQPHDRIDLSLMYVDIFLTVPVVEDGSEGFIIIRFATLKIFLTVSTNFSTQVI